MNNRVISLFALLFALTIVFAYIVPTWSGPIADAKAAIASDNDALDAAAAYNARQDQLVKASREIDETSMARLTTLLPDSVDNVALILSLNALAARSGLSLSNIDVSGGGTSAASPVSSATVNPVNSIDLSLSASGPYASFQKFLDGVEKSERLLDLRNITVTGSNSGTYTYQMTVRLYWLR
jgi:Tfp pilus assembly protein PilO